MVGLTYFSESVKAAFVAEELSVDGLYTAVFDWSAIQTGFLFGIFGYVMGSDDGFLEKIKDTATLSRFVSYTKRATVIGFFLTFYSIPLIVLSPKIGAESEVVYYFVTAWFSLFVWAFLAFARVAYLFGILLRPRAKKEFPA